MASNELQGYKIQGIYYLNKRTHRIQQNVGGACPLLALSNTLFLNHQIHYNKGGRRIKFEELTDCLTQHLQNMLNVDSVDGHKVKTELKVDKHKTATNHHQSLLNHLSIDDDDEDEVTVATTLFDDDSHDEMDCDIGIDVDCDIETTHSDKPPPDTMECKDTERMHAPLAPLAPTPTIDTDSKECIQPPPIESCTEAPVADPKAAEMEAKLKIIEECVQLFPKLEEGLDIDIKFSDGCDFEENPGYRMFAHYGFKLFHGWVVDPKEEKLHGLIGNKSYDETIDFLISDPPDTASEEEKKELEDNKDIIRTFFAESATQLTSYGLERLYTLMEVEDLLAIFFRNNHFSTIVKHAGIMYEFVTDEGIVDADPQITWQTLLQISGDEQFVNNKFLSIHTNISQYTQIAQYNRIKFQQDNPNMFDDENGECKTQKKGSGDCKTQDKDQVVAVINDALEYIDSESFAKLKKETDDDIDPLLSHGLTQRTTDTLDRFMCRDYLYGIALHNAKCEQETTHISFRVRNFIMADAQSILDLMCVAHDPSYPHFKNIDFMHDDSQFALVIEAHTPAVSPSLSSSNAIVGCCKYEWTKFNFWDWRESDWEDYDMDSVYNMSNTKYQRQRLLRESGVRCDYFVHILDLAISSEYAHGGLGAQLLQCLVYGFPSHSKFGVEVPATNTPAVKCFTKCGFTIARVEQTYGTKYKMTAESKFSIAQYRSFIHNSTVVVPKETLTKEKEKEKEEMTITIPQLEHTIHDDIDIDIAAPSQDAPATATATATTTQAHIHDSSIPDGGVVHSAGRHVEDAIDDAYDDDMDGTEEYEEDDEDSRGVVEEEEDDDINGIQSGHSVVSADRQMVRHPEEEEHHHSHHSHHHHHHHHQPSVIHHQGGGDRDLMGNINNMGGLFGYGGGDNFILSTLFELNLNKYNQIFTEFNINKEALLHLDSAVVECMIDDEKDRNKFLDWLQKYKQPPSKPPAQHSTNSKTKDSPTNTHHTQHDPMGIDTDDDDQLNIIR